MKRIYISYILLFVAILICATQFLYVSENCDVFTQEIEIIENLYNNKEYVEALTLSNKMYEKWQNRVKYTDMFLFHEYVDAITKNIDTMRIYIFHKKDTEFFAVCAELRNQISTLKNSEKPKIENII